MAPFSGSGGRKGDAKTQTFGSSVCAAVLSPEWGDWNVATGGAKSALRRTERNPWGVTGHLACPGRGRGNAARAGATVDTGLPLFLPSSGRAVQQNGYEFSGRYSAVKTL